jgi:FMN phosphatase YigB (HAD superfamily)
MIEFVYFDLGGVTILDFSGTDKWSQLKKELGIGVDKEKQFEDFWEKNEPGLCLGKRDTDSLLPLMKQELGISVPDNYSLLIDGFVNRFETNKSIWPVINKIHKVCKVGLLTNAYTGMLDAIKKKRILPDVTWDITIDSSIVGLQKPDPEIFFLAQEKAKASGKEILFVENSPKHTKAAEQFGSWQTFLYDSSKPEDSSNKLSELWNNIGAAKQNER